MKKYQQGGSPMPNFWEAGLESLNFDLYKNAFDQRSAYGNQFTTEMNNLKPPDPPKKSIWAKRNNRRAGEYRAAVEDYENKKSTATEQYKQVNSMMLPLGMLMQGQQGYMDYLSRPKENLQEEQGFFGFKQGGNVNKTGYTPGYASMNNSYNIIPSNNITMKNTPFPVLGIGSNGQKQMMIPGQQYSFGDSSHVIEYPMKYQEGGPPSGQGLQKFEDYKPTEEDLLNIPQHALMEALTGIRKSPSEILYEHGALDSNKILHRIIGTGEDLLLDPNNYFSGPRNIGMKGEQLGLTTLGKYIKAALTGDNIRDIYTGLLKGGSDKYKKIDPQNDKKTKIENREEGGEVNQEPVPLQAEKGEWFSTPDGLLAKVKAKESHKKQDKDEVSDILEPGSFIYSDDKKLIIDKTKKVKGIDLEEITFGRGPIEYKETEQTPLPKEIKFIDIMNKNKMTPAQIAAQIYAKYPSTDREKDAFSISANEQNKGSRMPYLAVLQELNKRKQTKQPQQYKYGGFVQHFQEGGYAQAPEAFTNMVINQTEAKYNDTLRTAGDPYEYRQLKDGTYQTKKRTASNWINMNENQTTALNKQIEAGIFDANYKPKNVKPAATVRTKQELIKHEEKVIPYTKSGYAFNVDLNHKVENVEGQYNNNPYKSYNGVNNKQGFAFNTDLSPGNTANINGQYNNTPYVPYISNSQASQLSNQVSNPSSGYQFQVSDNQNTSDNMQAYGDPTNAQVFNQYYIPYSIGSAPIGVLAPEVTGGAAIVEGSLGQAANQITQSAAKRATIDAMQQGARAARVAKRLNPYGIPGYQQGGMLKPMGMMNTIYNQPTNNAITGLGYKDPMEQRDKAFRNQGVYGSNLYSQPSTTNKNLFKFEQGGYTPHYQQGGSNEKTYGGGMWGGLVGSVTDIVTGIFNQARGDKNAKKSQKELDANKLEQLATNANMNNINMAGAIGNYASQDPAYEYLNLQNQYARGDNAYQNIGSNLDNAQLAAQNQAMTGSAGFMRNAASMGLSPYQSANYAANMQANAINNNNQLGLNYANQRNNNIRRQLQYNSGLDNMYSQDQQLGKASVRGNLNKLNSSLISGITSNGINKLSADQNIRNNYLANTMGLRNQTYRQMVEQNMMMGNNIKNAFNNGQGLYLNQQQQNIQNRNNYQNDPSGNYYGFSGSNPYGQFPYDSGAANYQFNPNDPNYDNVG
jgi:hypothetical protein